MNPLSDFLGKLRNIQSLMVLVSTYKVGIETKEGEYQELRTNLKKYFELFDIPDPNHFPSLKDFYGYYRAKLPTWQERRKFIREMYEETERVVESALKQGVLEMRPKNQEALEPPKILFLTANPKEIVKLRLNEEVRDVEHRIMLAQKKDQLLLINKGAVRVNDLQLYLDQVRPTIVHFSGHGTNEGEIILEDQSGNAKIVPPGALAKMFQVLKDNIRCVVLNACFSNKQASAIAQYIECVIGMSTFISDEAARKFSAAFYQAISCERSIGNAFDQGITALMLEGIPEEHIPQLLVREGANPSEIFLLKPERSHERLESTSRISRERAEKLAFALVKGKEEDACNIEISGVKMEKEGWVVKGAYSKKINKDLDWTFYFIVRIDNCGEIVEYNSNA